MKQFAFTCDVLTFIISFFLFNCIGTKDVGGVPPKRAIQHNESLGMTVIILPACSLCQWQCALSEFFPGEQVLCSCFFGFAAALQGQLKITQIQAKLHLDVEVKLQSPQSGLQKSRQDDPESAAIMVHVLLRGADEQEPYSRGTEQLGNTACPHLLAFSPGKCIDRTNIWSLWKKTLL